MNSTGRKPNRSSRLLDALTQYQCGDPASARGDIDALREAMEQYRSARAEMYKPTPFYKTINIFPTHPYRKFARTTQSPSEAIASHWEKVGEYLSFAIAQHILHAEEYDDSKNEPTA